MRRRAFLASASVGVAGLGGCLLFPRGARNEPPPAVGVLRFLNFHGAPHEVTAAFADDDGERLYEYTASLPAGSAEAPTRETARPGESWDDWTLKTRLDGEKPNDLAAIPQERIEYSKIDIEFRVMRDGTLRVRVGSAE